MTKKIKKLSDIKLPIYKQVAEDLKKNIKNNNFFPDMRLPSISRLKKHYGVSKTSVINALEYLKSESIIYAKPSSGCFIAEEAWRFIRKDSPNWNKYIKKSWQNISRESWLLSIKSHNNYSTIKLNVPSVNKELGSHIPIIAAMKDAINVVKKTDLIGNFHPQGPVSVRETIAEHLKRFKIKTTATQIILTPGMFYSINIIISALMGCGATLFCEKPSFLLAMTHITSIGINVIGLKMDDEGMSLKELLSNIHAAKSPVVCINPTCHYLTGITMSQKRREDILDLCKQSKIPIIELDYFSDLYPETVSFKSMDNSDMVIYIGTISYNLSTGIMTSWIVVPEYLKARLVDIASQKEMFQNNLDHIVTDQLLSKGYYYDYLKRSVPLFHKHFRLTDKLLDKYIGDIATWDKDIRANCFFIQFNNAIDTRLLLKKADGLLFSLVSIYDPEDTTHIIIRPLSLTPEQLEKGIKMLSDLARSIC